MKYFVVLALGLSLNVFAVDKSGSKCGLVDDWGDVDDATTTYDLSEEAPTARKLRSLHIAVKRQLVAAANLISERFKEKVVFKDVKKDLKEATMFVKEASEAGDLYILKAEIKGKKYSVVSYYGGGNHTGYIFPWGKNKAVASIGDDDVSCM